VTRRRSSTLALSALAAASVVSCVLFVSPDDHGTRCRFAGEETACGACLRERCQTDIDACCRVPACDKTLTEIDACAQGDRARCSVATSDHAAAEPTRASLAICLATKCREACLAPATTSITECSRPSFSGGHACTCVVSASPNDERCSEAVLPETICCAPQGWPGPGLRCSCRTVSCGPSSGGCGCFLADGTPRGADCRAAVCCQDNDVCRCGSAPCDPHEKPVAACSRATLGCALGQVRVASCEARRAE